MIAKAIKGRGFRGVLEYNLNEDKGELLDTNMAGSNARACQRVWRNSQATPPAQQSRVTRFPIRRHW